MIPHALVLEHVCGPICRLGLFAQRPSPSGGEPRLLGPLGNPSVENHDFSLLPPRATHGLVSTLPYRYSRYDDTWGIMRRVHQSGHPQIPHVRYHTSNIQRPCPCPCPRPCPCPDGPHLRSIIGHVAGWLRPYSRERYTRTTRTTWTGLEDPILASIRLQNTGERASGGSAWSSIHPTTHSFNQLFRSLTLPGSGCQGGLMQGAYHISTESIVLGPSGQANFLSIIAGHAVPRTERHDHSQPHNRNSTQKRPGLEQISGTPMS